MTLKDLVLSGQKVLMRVDFNVPLDGEKITDDTRLQAALPSIQYLLNHGSPLILMSHLGRPKGKDPNFSLAPIAKRLSELLQKPVQMAPDCIGKETEKLASSLKPSQILLLENLRFHPEEEAGDENFAKNLAKLGDVYINDAFGSAHRAHASTATIAQFFPHRAAMGFLMEKEVEKLSLLLKDPKHPYYAIIGGAKIGSKLGIIEKLLQKIDGLFLAGTIFKEMDLVKKLNSPKIHLPIDWVLSNGDPMDIGPKTIDEWKKKLQDAATIFWNGPLGAFEKKEFAKGTHEIAAFLAYCKAKVIVGGGDSVSAIQQMGFSHRFDHLSTGGGASLEFLEFGHLPGIDALSSINSTNMSE